jgi:general nucleoside transport system permease protein
MKVEERPAVPEPQPGAEAAVRRVDWAAWLRDHGLRLLAPAVSLLAAALIGALVVLLVRRNAHDVADVAGAMWSYGLANKNAPAFILGRATPFIFAGIATALAFKAGLFNIGVEGQYAIGALVAAVAGSRLSLPLAIHVPVTLLAGMLGGAVWALVPALLKVYRGAHEVISTIMMNYLANGVLLYLLSGPLKDKKQIGVIAQQQTAQVKPSASVGSVVPFLNSIGFAFRRSAPLTWLLLLALAGAAIYSFVIRRTRFGFEVRVFGTNPRAAEPAGIRANRMMLRAMLLSGAIAGLAGLQDVLGLEHRMKIDYVRGYGFTAIAIALLGRNSGLGIVAAALLFAFLDHSATGIGLNTDVPKEVTVILQGVIILTIVVSYELFRRLAARRRLQETHERA